MQFSSLIGHTHEVLGIIHDSDKPADSLLDSFFRTRKYLGSHDRKFIAETTYGVLRHRSRCESLAQSVTASLPAAAKAKDGLFWVILAYLVSVERRADLDASALKLVAETTGDKTQGAGILEKFREGSTGPAETPAGRIAQEYSFQPWMVDRLIQEYGGQEAEAICSSLNNQAPLTLRVNTLKGTVEECQAALKSEGIETVRTELSPFGLRVAKRANLFGLSAFRQGLFEVQDEGSQLVPILIDPKPTDKVLDACAGAGGKTLQLAAHMRNRGEIIASDINAFRLRELRKRSNRAGAFNIKVKSTDELKEQSDSYRGYFDIVFIDAPCSGMGTIRRNPGMKWSISEDGIKELSAKQSSILSSHAEFVAPGGLLVYATCTMVREENEDVVDRFLNEAPHFRLVDPERHTRKTGISNCTRNGHFVISPTTHGTDGFFCAVLERIPEGESR